MIASCILLGFPFEGRGRGRWIGLTAAVPLAALLLTFTRNAYVGMLAALLAYLLWRRPQGLLLLLPALVLVVCAASCRRFASRIRSIGDLSDPSNRDRVAMAHAGMRMVGDFPVFGLGPEMVKRYYPLYRDPDALHWNVRTCTTTPYRSPRPTGVPAAATYLGAGHPSDRRIRAASAPRAAARGRGAAGRPCCSPRSRFSSPASSNTTSATPRSRWRRCSSGPCRSPRRPPRIGSRARPIRMSRMFPRPVPAAAPPRPYTVSELLAEVGVAL